MNMTQTKRMRFTKIDDENFILLGIAKLDDINDELGIDLESEDYDSIAGHIINLLDHFPESRGNCTG